MFSHVMLGTSDLEKARAFYDPLLATLGIKSGRQQGKRIFWRNSGGMFGVTLPLNGEAPTHANGGTIGFKCKSPEQVREFHDTAVANGGISIEDPPGPRNNSMGSMHLSYVRDPDGNKLCALYRGK